MAWWTALTLSQTTSLFPVLRNEIILALTQIEGIALFVGDSTQFVSSVNRIIGNDAILLALDAYRVCSLGMFVRRISEEMLICDLPTTEKMLELLQSRVPSHPLISRVELNRNLCFLSVNALDTEKSKGAQALLEKWIKFDDVIMIGDSMADFLNLPCIRHWAVGNADPRFQKLAEKTATKDYTRGCIELLSTI